MDDKTFEYWAKRLDDARYVQREIAEWKHRRRLAIEITTTVCPQNASGGYYNADLP